MWDFHSHFFCKFPDTSLQLINARSHLINFCDNGVRHSLQPGLHLLERVLNKSNHICSALSWIMPALMKINLWNTKASARMNDASSKPVMVKSKLKRIFEQQFQGVLRNSCVENPPSQALSRVFPDPRPPRESSRLHDNNNNTNDNNLNVPRTTSNYFGGSGRYHKSSSLCLSEMVYNFMENGGKNSDCGRPRCNWFNGLYSGDGNGDSGDDPKSTFAPGEVCDIRKSIVPCASVCERNLLADVSKLVEALSDEGNNVCKDKEDCTNGYLRRAVMNRLRSSGYNAAVCKSRWDHANGYPSREYEYIDVIGEI